VQRHSQNRPNADKVSDNYVLEKSSVLRRSLNRSVMRRTAKLVWEIVPRRRSSGAKAAVSELGSCARLIFSIFSKTS